MGQKLSVELEVINKATKELNSIGRDVNTFQNKIVAMGRALTGIFVGGAATAAVYSGLKNMIKTGLEYGDAMTDAAKRTGQTVEEVQKLDFIAMKSGISIDRLQKPLREMAKAAFEGNAAFKILGIETRDVNGGFLQSGDIFRETILRLSEIKNTTERSAITSKIFGRASGDVLAIINRGRGEIQEYYKELEKYNLVLGGDTVNELHEAKEASELAGRAWKSASAQLTIAFTPALVEYTGWLAKAAKALKEFGEPKKFDMLDAVQKKFDQFKADKAIQIGVGDKKTMAEFKAYEMQIAAYQKMKDEANKPGKNEFDNGQFDTKAAEAAREAAAREAAARARAAAEAAARKKEEAQKKLLDHTRKDLAEDAKAAYEIKKSAFDADQKIRDENYRQAQEDSDRRRAIREQEIQEQRDANERSLNAASEWGQSYGRLIGENLGKGKEGFHNFLKGSLVMVVDYIEKKALAAATANILDNTIALGPIGLAKGFAEAAGITALAEGVKAGINGFANGTPYAPGGLSYVGEHGRPELVNLPRGSQVFNSSQTKNMTTNNGGNLTVHIHGENGGDAVSSLNTSIRRGTANVDELVDLLYERFARRG
jgi:hypothetical protein